MKGRNVQGWRVWKPSVPVNTSGTAASGNIWDPSKYHWCKLCYSSFVFPFCSSVTFCSRSKKSIINISQKQLQYSTNTNTLFFCHTVLSLTGVSEKRNLYFCCGYSFITALLSLCCPGRQTSQLLFELERVLKGFELFNMYCMNRRASGFFKKFRWLLYKLTMKNNYNYVNI